jgi:hypothetical protein
MRMLCTVAVVLSPVMFSERFILSLKRVTQWVK